MPDLWADIWSVTDRPDVEEIVDPEERQETEAPIEELL